MRSILVNADRSAGSDARVETALALARAMGGHVTVLIDTPVARYISMDPMGGSYVATGALNDALAEDDAAAVRFQANLQAQDVPFDVIRSEAEPVEALAMAARLSDLVVLSRAGGLASDVALTAHTPVLVVPEGQVLAMPFSKVCIAWDGGDEAALALRSAVPLLAGCASVDVLTVAEKPRGFPATDALSYLSRHGVTAELRELERGRSTEETLALEVARSGAELLVMGAYGHSRMREYLLGGVTRYFLEEVEAPALLLAH